MKYAKKIVQTVYLHDSETVFTILRPFYDSETGFCDSEDWFTTIQATVFRNCYPSSRQQSAPWSAWRRHWKCYSCGIRSRRPVGELWNRASQLCAPDATGDATGSATPAPASHLSLWHLNYHKFFFFIPKKGENTKRTKTSYFSWTRITRNLP